MARIQVSETVAQCSQLSLSIIADDGGVGTPPYYMIAMVPGGIPTTTFIGNDGASLSWPVNQPVGE